MKLSILLGLTFTLAYSPSYAFKVPPPLNESLKAKGIDINAVPVDIANPELFKSLNEAATSDHAKVNNENEIENDETIKISEDSEIDFEFASQFFQPKICIQRLENFVGCISVIETYYAFLGKQILHSQKAKNYLENLNSKIEFLLINDFSIEMKNIDLVLSPYQFKQLKNLKFEDYKNLFSNAQAKVEFLQYQKNVLNHMKENKSKLNKAQWAAVLNTYLENNDAPHTEFYNEEEILNKTKDQVFYGIGVVLHQQGAHFFVQTVPEESASAAVGVQPGWSIVKVNGEPTDKMELNALVQKLRGPENTTVNVTFLDNQQLIEKTIKRKKVEVKNVKSRLIKINNKKYGYISLSSFMLSTYTNNAKIFQDAVNALKQDIINAIHNFESQNVEGILFDLRGNGGGYTSLANVIASLFLKKESLFSILEDSANSHYSTLLTTEHPVYNGKLVILQNSSSASASEMFSNAMKFYERALIVGRTSFGKGSSQTPSLIKLKDGYSLKKNNGLFYSPSGLTNQTIGVSPHLESWKTLEAQESEAEAEFHEQDKYFFPLAAKRIAVPFPAELPNKKIQISQSCMKEQKVEETYKSLNKNDNNRDLQILTGIGGLNCMQ